MPIQTSKNKRRRRYAAPIGGVFIILAVIGVVTVAAISINMTTRFLDNTSEKERFAELIRPVAMFDPGPFEDPTSIEMTSLLRYGLFATVKSERNTYEYDEFAELVVPASDIDVAVAQLFGPEVELEHQTFGDMEATYVYDAELGVYSVPTSYQLFVYSPVVEEITRDGDYYNLHVGYVPPTTAWTDSGGNTPDKYMIYVMKRVGDSYQIAKVRDVPSETDQPLEGPLANSAG